MEEYSATQTAVACTACQAAQPCPEHRGTSPVGGNPTPELSGIPQADPALLLSTTDATPLPAVQVATSSPTPQTGDSGIAVGVDAEEAYRQPSVEPRDAPNEPAAQEPVAPAVKMPEPGAAKLAGGAGSWRRSDIKLVIHLTPHGNRFEAILSAGGTSGMIPIPAPRLKRLGRVSVTEAITELEPFWEECQLVWDEKPTYSYYRPAPQPSATPAARTQRRARAKDIFETRPPAEEGAGAVAHEAAAREAESAQGQLGLF